MKKVFALLFTLILLLLSTGKSHAQSSLFTFNFGMHDTNGLVTMGISSPLESPLEFDVMLRTPNDESTIGGKVGYIYSLYQDGGFSFYIAPRVGLLNTSYSDDRDSVTGLIYEGAAGIYLSPFNFSAGYGFDEVSDTEYISFKVGFSLFYNM